LCAISPNLAPHSAASWQQCSSARVISADTAAGSADSWQLRFVASTDFANTAVHLVDSPQHFAMVLLAHALSRTAVLWQRLLSTLSVATSSANIAAHNFPRPNPLPSTSQLPLLPQHISPPIVFHCCLCRARKKLKRQECVLREVVVHMTQLKITTSKINKEVIVFDRGNNNTPPICPPNGIQWHSISVRELCTEDKTGGDIGLILL
jgi:hypothetical protein